ncbi:MAG: hypothetical protein ACREJ3_03290, partial [Polyangiaceae bacterium]
MMTRDATPRSNTSPRSKIAAAATLGAIATGACALIALRMHFEPPTIPEYRIVESSQRADAGAPSFAPGGQFEIDLSPAAPITGAVGARAFLLRGDTVRPWNPPFSVSQDGSIRIAGAVDTLFAGVPKGDWAVAVAVGRPATLPTAPR